MEELPDIFDILDDGDGNITTEEYPAVNANTGKVEDESRAMELCQESFLSLLMKHHENIIIHKIDKASCPGSAWA